MSADNIEEAVDVLQQLGLKEYEARCFVGLSRLSTATAKELDEVTDVPRTRVYDAIRVLEAQGLVEVQHSSPKRFRAVDLSEATETLREQYEGRVGRATTFVSGLGWLRGPVGDEAERENGEEPAVGRLLLVDRSSLLVSSLVPTTGEEHAVFGTGFGNGLIVIARRLMAQGLMRPDPGNRQA